MSLHQSMCTTSFLPIPCHIHGILSSPPLCIELLRSSRFPSFQQSKTTHHPCSLPSLSLCLIFLSIVPFTEIGDPRHLSSLNSSCSSPFSLILSGSFSSLVGRLCAVFYCSSLQFSSIFSSRIPLQNRTLNWLLSFSAESVTITVSSTNYFPWGFQ